MDRLGQIDSLIGQLKSSGQAKSLEDLINSLEKLSTLCHKLNNLGPQYDWKDLPYNGYRSIVKLSILFTADVIQPSLNCKKIYNESLVGVINLLIAMAERAIIFSQETKTPPEKITETITDKFFIGTKQHFEDIESHLKHYWGHHGLFWTTPSNRWLINSAIQSIVFAYKLPKSLLPSTPNEEYGALLTRVAWKVTPLSVVHIINFLFDNFFSGACSSVLCIVNGVTLQKFLVPRQSKWIVPDDGSRISKPSSKPVDLNFNENLNIIDGEQNSVQCYLIKSKSLIPSGDVIIYAQGGGFIVKSRLFSETYLRNWVQKLNGAAIINVIYSRFVRYPCALQEFIDVYFWLTSGSQDVIKTLGFKPRRIICLGDSVGVLLLLSMCCAVRDIQLICPSDITLYPETLMGISPLPSIGTQNMFPSFLLSYVDILLPPSLLMQSPSLYGSGILFDSECSDLDNNNENANFKTSSPPWLNPPTFTSFYENSHRNWTQNKGWFDCEPDKFRTRAFKIASRMSLPYISPLISYDFNAISDLKLVLISSEFDPFLDMTIELAKKWKGKVSCDVIENIPHGFYGSIIFDNECYKAMEFCLQKLGDICS